MTQASASNQNPRSMSLPPLSLPEERFKAKLYSRTSLGLLAKSRFLMSISQDLAPPADRGQSPNSSQI